MEAAEARTARRYTVAAAKKEVMLGIPFPLSRCRNQLLQEKVYLAAGNF